MINFTPEKKNTLFEALAQLKQITELLRSEEGCPWDRKQSNKDFALYLIDETYEYIDAINNKDFDNQKEELGDMYNNVLMLLTIHQQNDDVNVIDSINEECEKIVRRHPHVFSSQFENLDIDSDQVINIWDDVKKNVENRHEDKLDFFKKIPSALPQLDYSYECMKKVSKIGFDWEKSDDVADKIIEELKEVKEAINLKDKEALEDEIGDLLLAVINYSRFLKVRPDVALRRSTNKFKERFNKLNQICENEKIPISLDNISDLNRVWDFVKNKK